MHLIQEKYQGDPWKVLVACILLNKSRGEKAVPIIQKVLGIIPHPRYLYAFGRAPIEEIIAPLGLQNTRMKSLFSLASGILDGTPIERIKGIGRYALDSYEIFVNGNEEIVPMDKKLRAYLEGRKNVSRSFLG